MAKGKAKLMAQALKLYLESNGEESIKSLSAKVGVNRNTLMNWRDRYDWRGKLEEVRKTLGTKLIEQVSAEHVEGAIETWKHFETNKKHLEDFDKIITGMLYQKNEDGSIKHDIIGNPIRVTEIPPNNLDALTRAMARVVDTRISVLKVLGINVQVSADGQGLVPVIQDGDTPGYLDDIIQKIIRQGDKEGQLQLMRIQDALQRLLDGKK